MRISDWSSDVCSSDLQSAEWRHVQAELQAGKKLVKLFYGLTSISPLGQGDAHERIIKAIYKAAGWDLADERFLQLQGLVAAFPLSLDRKSTRLNSSH